MEKYKLIDRTGHHHLGEVTSEDIEVLAETLQLEHASDTDFYVSMDAIEALREREADLGKLATALREQDKAGIEAIPERGKDLVKQYEAILLAREADEALEGIAKRREVLERLTVVLEKAVQAREDYKKESAAAARALETELNGEIAKLKQSYRETTDAEKQQALQLEINAAEERLKNAYKDVGDLTGIDVQWTRRTYTHALNVEVRSATNLAKADVIGKSDPYAVIEVVDNGGTIMSQTRTKHIPVNLNPVWGHVCSFLVRNTDALRIQIYDHDVVSSDDFLGRTVFVIKELPLTKALEGSYKLDNAKSGEVQVWMRLNELTPLEG